MSKELKLCPFCLSEAMEAYEGSKGNFTHVTCSNRKCRFESIMDIESWNFRPINNAEKEHEIHLPFSKDDYKPERTDIRDSLGFTIAENVFQKDADFIINCCNKDIKIKKDEEGPLFKNCKFSNK